MWKYALRNLLSRPLRSVLSLLGMTIAISGMVGLFSVSEGLHRMFSDTFDNAPGLLAQQPGSPVPLFSRLPSDWADEIAEFDEVSVVNRQIWQRVNVIDGKMIISPPRFLFGTEISTRLRLKTALYRKALIEGRFLQEGDQGTKVAVISKPIAEESGKSVGDTMRINQVEVTIVGIYLTESLLLDTTILMDIQTVREMTRFPADSVSCFYIEQKPDVDDKALARSIEDHFRGRNSASSSQPTEAVQTLKRIIGRIFPAPNNPPEAGEVLKPEPKPTPPPTERKTIDASLALEVKSASESVEQLDQFSQDLDVFLILITGIGVTVAVLSIVNTMLMSVTERIIEIGILKANGWTRWDVMRLITFESALLGFGGGVLGALLGWMGTLFVNAMWPEKVELFASPQLLLFSLGFSTALGVLGGLYPAYWAMRLMPMDAIRRG